MRIPIANGKSMDALPLVGLFFARTLNHLIGIALAMRFGGRAGIYLAALYCSAVTAWVDMSVLSRVLVWSGLLFDDEAVDGLVDKHAAGFPKSDADKEDPLGFSFDDAIKVSSVFDEYEHIEGLYGARGKVWLWIGQSLHVEPNGHAGRAFDRVEIEREGKREVFVFDITSFCPAIFFISKSVSKIEKPERPS